MNCENIRITGTVEILIYEGGVVVDSRTIHNLIVDMGKNYYARIAGDVGFTSTIRQIAMGKGTIPPVSGDVNLGNPLVAPGDVNDVSLAIAPVTRSNPTSKVAKFVATFPSGPGSLTTTSAIVSELVLIFDTSDLTYSSGTPLAFSADGGVFARVCGETFTPFSKSTAQTVVVSWYTQTEYAFITSDCNDCCPKVVALPDQALLNSDLGQGNVFDIAELSQDATFLAPFPTPEDGKRIEYRIKTTTPRNLTWTGFSSTDIPILTATSGTGFPDRMVFEYRSATSSWEAVDREAANIARGVSAFAGPYAIAIGAQARSDSYGVVIGGRAGNVLSRSYNDAFGVAIGPESVTAISEAVAIGDFVEAVGSAAVAIGEDVHTGSETNSYFATACIGMGESVNIGITGSVAAAIAMGQSCYVYSGGNGSVAIGQSNSIFEFSNASVCIGQSNTIATLSSGCVCLGQGNSIGQFCSNSFAAGGAGIDDNNPSSFAFGSSTNISGDSGGIGRNIAMGYQVSIEDCRSVIALGTDVSVLANTNIAMGISFTVGLGSTSNVVIIPQSFGSLGFTSSANNVVLGSAFLGDVVNKVVQIGYNVATGTSVSSCVAVGDTVTLGTGVSSSIVIGKNSTVNGSFGIALGTGITCNGNQMIIGSSTGPINAFDINGVDSLSSALTILHLEVPANPGEAGIYITYNNGAAVSSRHVKASNTPPGGSLYLYIDP